MILGYLISLILASLYVGVVTDDYAQKITQFNLTGREKTKYVLGRLTRDVIVIALVWSIWYVVDVNNL